MNVFVEYCNMKWELNLKSELVKAILISKQNQNQSKQLDIVPGATEQDLIANPFHRQPFASAKPRFPVRAPSLPLPLGIHKSVLHVQEENPL